MLVFCGQQRARESQPAARISWHNNLPEVGLISLLQRQGLIIMKQSCCGRLLKITVVDSLEHSGCQQYTDYTIASQLVQQINIVCRSWCSKNDVLLYYSSEILLAVKFMMVSQKEKLGTCIVQYCSELKCEPFFVCVEKNALEKKKIAH